MTGKVAGVDTTGALVLADGRGARASCRRDLAAPRVTHSRGPEPGLSHTLVIDVGNSRLKWGLAGRAAGCALGACANAEIGTLALRDWQNLPRPARVVGVNVAGEAARVRVEGAARRAGACTRNGSLASDAAAA